MLIRLRRRFQYQGILANPPNINDGLSPWTNYQYPLFSGEPFEPSARSTLDIAFDADPASGVWVRDMDSGGAWYVLGGTSLSSAALAGIVNSTNQRLGMAGPGGWYTPSELNHIYSVLPTHTAYPSNHYDVTTGSNGHAVGPGYDKCTGVGTPRGLKGK